MSTRICFALLCFAFMGVGCAPLMPVQDATVANEARHAHLAERIVAIGLAQALSHSIRERREICQRACFGEEWLVEFAISSIGVGRSAATDDALINLMGLALDGAASASLSCQLFIRGDTLASRLERLEAKSLVEHCRSTFYELRKHELRDISDAGIENFCSTEENIRRRQGWILEAIKVDERSSWEECFHQASGDSSLPLIQKTTVLDAHEAKFVRAAEHLIISELTRILSPSFQEERGKCQMKCSETRALEIAIGTIGIGKSDAAADALVNLLGLRLKGAGYDELNRQIFVRGQTLLSRLENMQTKSLVEHCRSTFYELQKQKTSDFDDADVEAICRTEKEILRERNLILEAIKAGTVNAMNQIPNIINADGTIQI